MATRRGVATIESREEVAVNVSSLSDYDAERLGPLLGVSDEGSAAAAIVAAALDSPKARALASATPLEIGVAHDGERLGSIGETPIGLDEFEAIRAAVGGKILITTNVGSHLNSWHYLRGPILDAGVGAADQIGEALADHLPAVGGVARLVPIYVRAPAQGTWDTAGLGAKLRVIAAGIQTPAGIEADPVLLVEIAGGNETARVVAALELARSGEIETVAIGGQPRPPTEGRTARPGLLNYFECAEAETLLARAAALGVKLRCQDIWDLTAVANQLWAGLETARRAGATAGKFSLYPLTFQEMAPVIARVERWFSDWTAAPAYYLDLEWVDGHKVFGVDSAADGAARWLELAGDCGVELVLLDTVDKAANRHLLKRGSQDDAGILFWPELVELDRAARQRGVKVLWAGGIRLDQVSDFGRLGCFGIYVTTAAARSQEISEAYASDPTLVAEREPTHEGVRSAKLQLEAGFLAERAPSGSDLADLAARALPKDAVAAEDELADRLRSSWRRFWAERTS